MLARQPARRLVLGMVSGRNEHRDRGSVTAELAIAIPAVLAVLIAGIGSVVIAARVVVVQDAASTLAREAARGDVAHLPPALAGRADVTRSDRDGLTCVTVTVAVPIAGVELPVSADSCALP